jgi:ammonium transporter, Amt family
LILENNTVSPSSIAGRAVCNTFLGGALGAISAILINLVVQYYPNKQYVYSLEMAINGALSGLVAITSACATIELYASIIIGIVAGLLYYTATKLLDRWKIDDVVQGIPVHMVNGIWAMLATGLFSSPDGMMSAYGNSNHVGLFYEWARNDNNNSNSSQLFFNQVIGILFIMGWTACTTTPVFLLLHFMGWFRTDSFEEIVGSDIRYNKGANAAGEQEGRADLDRYNEQKQLQQTQNSNGIDDNNSNNVGNEDDHDQSTQNPIQYQ